MTTFEHGSPVRKLTGVDSEDLGIVVCLDELKDELWYVPFPAVQTLKVLKEGRQGSPDDDENTQHLKTRTRHHIPAPVMLPLRATQEDEAYSAPPRKLPALLNMTDEELAANVMPNKHFKTRRDLKKSIRKRDKQWQWIEQLVLLPMPELLNLDRLREHAIKVQVAHGLPSYEPVIRALRCYWLWGRCKNALLPRYDKSNVIGQPKFTTKRTGRPAIDTPVEEQGIVCTRAVRRILRTAWMEYVVKQQHSAEVAYHMMLAKHFTHSGSDELLPLAQLPTEQQFNRHGPASDPAKKSSRVQRGQNDYDRNRRPLTGSARDGLAAAGIVCLIDSTHEDASLVATKSRLQPTATCYSTQVVENYTGYIFGVHIGYERRSQMTALLAIANAATPKEDFALPYGIELKPNEWLHYAFTRVTGDNGDIKGEIGFAALSTSEVTTEFCASLAAERKGLVEASQKSVASKAAHITTGSRKGRRHKRGEPDPAKRAAINYHEHVAQNIRAILFLNNHQRVAHLLTDEMRADGVKPFRRDIFLWMRKTGYVKTEAPSFDNIRPFCYPRVKCTVYRDGIYVEDPTAERKRYVNGLVYNSTALKDTGALDLGNKGFDAELLINPNALASAWINIRDRGLIEVHLKNADPLIHEKTFADFILQSEDDREFEKRNRHEELTAKVKLYGAADKQNQAALEEKAREQQSVQETSSAKPPEENGGGRKASSKRPGKAAATEKELADQNLNRLGIGKSTSKDEPKAPSPPAETITVARKTGGHGSKVRTQTKPSWLKSAQSKVLSSHAKH